MSFIPSFRARTLAISLTLFGVFMPSLVSAAPTTPSQPLQPGDTSKSTPAVCPIQSEVETTQTSDEIGSLEHPAPLGTIVTVKNADSEYKLGVSEVVRGSDAWKRIQRYDARNVPPADGKEYIMVFVVVRYVSGPASAANEFCFNAITRQQVMADLPAVFVRPGFKVEYTSEIPGGGWIVGEVYPDDPNPVLLVGFGTDGQTNVYFATQDLA